jgi:hypothetical protein
MKVMIKLCLVALLCVISYWTGWGNGQANAYYKMDHAPSLYSK